MTLRRRPVSLVAERAVRLLQESTEPLDSITLAGQVLATRAPDEETARRILEAAFNRDPRLVYENGAWTCATVRVEPRESAPFGPERDRVLVLLAGSRPGPRRPFELTEVAGIRLQGNTVVAACGGEPRPGYAGESLRQEFLETLEGGVPVLHDAPGALAALERWLEEPLEGPVSLRLLARDRLHLPAGHDLETLVEKLDLDWRAPDELLDQAEVLDMCLEALRRRGETLQDLRSCLASPFPPVPWSRYDFDRGFLRSIPRVAGTYRFYDADGGLLYVGKAKNLHLRIGSYFGESGSRSARVQSLLDSLHRIEFEPLHSDLEAMLREAAEIRKRHPSRNVQRRIHSSGRGARLRSIMILEPATSPLVLRAYLIRDGQLLDKVGIGPRGGGIRRIERLLEDHFFSIPEGPTPTPGPDLNMELVARWLAANREKVVAFDPTTLRNAMEVTDRLRGLLASGALFDPDGTPVLIR